MQLNQVVKRLNLLAPLRLAGDWDNVGLLLEAAPNAEIENIVLTNDLNDRVLTETKSKQSSNSSGQLLFSYHPPIFAPMKQICYSNWKERLIIKSLQSNISIFAPHTSFDNVSWLNNHHLVKCAIGATDQYLLKKAKWNPILPVDFLCSKVLNINTFSGMALGGAAIETIFSVLSKVDSSCFVNVRVSHETNEFQIITDFDITDKLQLKPSKVSLANSSDLYGAGLKVTMNDVLSEKDALNNLKHFLQLRYLRYSCGVNRSLESNVKSFAVCAGSGSDVLKSCVGKVDLIITGELSHHYILDAQQKGTSVVLTEHSNSERSFLHSFRDTLVALNLLKDVKIFISETDADPLDVY